MQLLDSTWHCQNVTLTFTFFAADTFSYPLDQIRTFLGHMFTGFNDVEVFIRDFNSVFSIRLNGVISDTFNFFDSCEAMAYSLPLLLGALCCLSVAHGVLRVFNMRASGLETDIFGGDTDGYVRGFCNSASLGQTSVRKDDANPWWSEEFVSFTCAENAVLTLEVHDSDLIFDNMLGSCQTSVITGTNSNTCYLEGGAVFYYTVEYTLS
ncbi:uncharacterized protein V6R79_013531 [Siganus canaliculatus]